MSPAEVRWRCERMAVLLQVESKAEAVLIVETEANTRPWEGESRPALPLMGSGYVGPDP